MMDERRFIDPTTDMLWVFNTLESEDSGFYTCLAWNAVGTDQHTVLVQVTDITSESLAPPLPHCPSPSPLSPSHIYHPCPLLSRLPFFDPS